MQLTIGQAAPPFTLPRAEGDPVSLSGFAGRKVVLFFYPKDDTPGCTQESREFDALRDRFAAIDTEVIGVSPDSVKSHSKFAGKHELGLTLLSDEAKTVLESYGVWAEKSMYGRKYMGVERTTFLIGRDGRIAKVWPKVKVSNHAQEVLDAAAAL